MTTETEIVPATPNEKVSTGVVEERAFVLELEQERDYEFRVSCALPYLVLPESSIVGSSLRHPSLLVEHGVFGWSRQE